MAIGTWARTLGTAAGAAGVAGAGQLGIAYGLGILRADQDFATATLWHTQLVWLAFVAALAVVAGAGVTFWAPSSWTGQPHGRTPALGVRLAVVAVAVLGAGAVTPLATRPLHGAAIPGGTGAPGAAASAMLLGLVVGAAVAVAAAWIPAAAGNATTTVVWLWLAALASAVWTLGGGALWASAGLGLVPPAGPVTAVVTLVGVPVLIALGSAAVARFGGSDRPSIVAGGATGPLLVAGAYLIGGQGGAHPVAYWCALLGVPAGLAASTAVAVLGPVAGAAGRTGRPAPHRAPSTGDDGYDPVGTPAGDRPGGPGGDPAATDLWPVASGLATGTGTAPAGRPATSGTSGAGSTGTGAADEWKPAPWEPPPWDPPSWARGTGETATVDEPAPAGRSTAAADSARPVAAGDPPRPVPRDEPVRSAPAGRDPAPPPRSGGPLFFEPAPAPEAPEPPTAGRSFSFFDPSDSAPPAGSPVSGPPLPRSGGPSTGTPPVRPAEPPAAPGGRGSRRQSPAGVGAPGGGRRRQHDDEYVDWISGLGGDPEAEPAAPPEPV